MKTQLDVRLPVSIFKEGDTFIAYCPVLDLSTSAKTFEQTQKRFTQAVEVFFEELLEMGTLDEVLSSYGWTKTQSRWNPPLPISHEFTNVSIPLTS
ncbi:hypothetical protein HYV22_03700 [Candidatus Gottesmanbacteria bacterium]|nr:hypothetical protein [Candidatus Gottesmanbacteria bacterium]